MWLCMPGLFIATLGTLAKSFRLQLMLTHSPEIASMLYVYASVG